NLPTPLSALARQLEQLLSLGEPGERSALQQLLEAALLRLAQPGA
ncbi:sigma-54-dependent Fis family transcriptional regulator, partial [Pseudomonas frederiksbergensis]|nr:sigma-54-dependent Fis family transcriptional regulator [Pseudomonas frederiksbergensis]